MQAILFTAEFERQAKQIGLDDRAVAEIANWLADDPLAGDIIPGTGGARKVRFAGRGHGKSGGYRTIHYFGGTDVPIFLLAILDKGDRANLSKAECNALADILPRIAGAYRAGVKERVVAFRKRNST